jgi:protein phosphatase PTC7
MKAFDMEHEIKDKDIVVMGSDGLFDNLYHEDLLTCIYPQYEKGASRYDTGFVKDPRLAAECMAKKSEEKSYQQFYFSPFARGAQEAGIGYRGGKPDDITVIVA